MKTQGYNIFYQRIYKSAKEKGFPLRVMFELTYHCNFKCKHCYIPHSYQNQYKNKELKTKEIFLILDQLSDIGCFYLGFTGGEPFVRKDIMEILRYAKRKGFEIIIYTNGSLMDKEIANELASLMPNKVDITIPAISKVAFERITGVPGSRDKVFKTIELLHRNGIALGFKTCVLKENELEIEKIQDFASSLGVLHRLDDMLLPRLDGSKKPYIYRGSLGPEVVHKLRMVNVEDSENCGLDSLSSVTGYRKKHKFSNREPRTENREPISTGLFKCGVGINQAAITPLAELKACLMIDHPKYKIKSDLKDAWEKLRSFISSLGPDKDYKCSKCNLKNYCKWCPARGWLYNKSFTSCDPEIRKKAKFINQPTNC